MRNAFRAFALLVLTALICVGTVSRDATAAAR